MTAGKLEDKEEAPPEFGAPMPQVKQEPLTPD